MLSLWEQSVAIVFDVDDTLVFTARNGYRKCVEVARQLCLEPPSLEQFFTVYGQLPFAQCVKYWHPQLGCVAEYQALYDRLQPQFPDEPCGHAGRVVAAFKYRGLRVGVLTNGPEHKILRKLQAAGVDPAVLDGLWHAGNLRYPKPDPRSFEPMLAQWRVQPAQVLYIGDSLSDLEASTAAGLRFAAVLTGSVPYTVYAERLPAHCILNDIDDLL